MARVDYYTASEILQIAPKARRADFHQWRTGEVDSLLAHADELGYRKPKNANGSRARYFHAYLTRIVDRERNR